jgi:hypothetical protein
MILLKYLLTEYSYDTSLAKAYPNSDNVEGQAHAALALNNLGRTIAPPATGWTL